jgi:hypothetical protein
MGVLLMDAGLLCLAVGFCSLLRPPRWLGIGTRRRAAAVAAAGAALAAGAIAWPAPLLRSTRRPARLDDVIPRYQFHERHELRIHAAPERIAWAIRTVTAGEIHLFRTLTWLPHPRLPGRPGEETILSPTAGKPILATALGSGFALLAEEPDRELVIGTLVIAPRRPAAGHAHPLSETAHPPSKTTRSEPAHPLSKTTHPPLPANAHPRAGIPRHPLPAFPDADFAALAEPGYAKAALNFLIEPDAADPSTCLLSTETRVFATDPATRRRFAAYWRIIYPGSALIRLEWLRAIRRRAESPLPAS